MTLKARRKLLSFALVAVGVVGFGVGLWMLAGLPIVLVVLGAASVALGLLMEV